MAWTYKSILGGDNIVDLPQIKNEADTIVTSLILGMAGTRYYQRQPFSFDTEQKKKPGTVEGLKKSIKWDSQDSAAAEYKKQGKSPSEIWDLLYAQEYQDFLTTMSSLSYALDAFDGSMGSWLRDGQSHEGKGELITGRSSGAGISSTERNKIPDSQNTLRQVKLLKDATPEVLAEKGIYSGRGAYIGIWDDPLEEPLVDSEQSEEILYESMRPTLRVYQDNPGWRPGRGADQAHGLPWGTIGINASDPQYSNYVNFQPLRDGGMGPLPENIPERQIPNITVGYVHGMCTAIQQCRKAGPQSTPYEVAAGDNTTKIASCLACSTYMYALGYPPSSAHLGRGESWRPPSDLAKVAITDTGNYPINVHGGQPTHSTPAIFNSSVVEADYALWQREVTSYIELGLKILIDGHERQKKRVKNLLNGTIDANWIPVPLVDADHLTIANIIKVKIAGEVRKNEYVSELFLNALTVHDSDWKRVRRTLAPAYTKIRVEEIRAQGVALKRATDDQI